MKTHWRLPRGVDEVLPPAAWSLEQLRRGVLDTFHAWGYDYVEPPVIEYLDSLLVGSGEDLDLQTLKMVDQVSGRQLGVRADMTSQAVRIDAHSLITDEVQRLCYAGPVVFANPQIAQSSRVPLKAGAELFGAEGLSADAEMISLMLEVMQVTGVHEPVLLVGHMGIYRALVQALIDSGELDAEDERALFGHVQRKSQADVGALLGTSDLAKMMACLPTLMGDDGVLDEAARVLDNAPVGVKAALAQLKELIETVTAQHAGLKLRLDIAELSGYGYHNGPVFAVYHPEHGSALAQGGRYDGIGEVFGRGRPATGFDVNLKNLVNAEDALASVFAPFPTAAARAAQAAAIAELRAQGYRVRCALSNGEAASANCRWLLEERDGAWQLVERVTG